MKERITLKVLEVSEPITLSQGGKVLEFKARSGDGKELKYKTFLKGIFSNIQKDAVIDVDAETSTRVTEAGTFIDHKVVQLYQDGQPVATQKSGGNWQKQDNTASIESQSALKFVGELLISKVIDMTHPLAVAAIKWSEERLGCGKPEVKPPQATKKAEPTTSPSTGLKAPPATQSAAKKLTYDELRKMAEEIGWTDVGSWMAKTYQIPGKTVKEVFDRLSSEHLIHLKKELEDRMAQWMFDK